MIRTRWVMMAALFGSLGSLRNASSQDQNIRKVDRFGEQRKILTSGQVDAWVFAGKKDQVVSAWVRSEAFDPVLELMDEKETELQKVDDPGSQSRFAARLPVDGTYRVRVRAFKDSGGGQYRLILDLFDALSLAPEVVQTGEIGSDGRSHHRIDAVAGDLMTVRLRSAAGPTWRMLDPKGVMLPRRSPLVRIESPGEHVIRISGRTGTRYGIVVRKALVRKLNAGAPGQGEVTLDRVEAWDLEGRPGEFARIDVKKSGPLQTELLFVPDGKNAPEGVIRSEPSRPEVEILSRYDKGAQTVLVGVLGRTGTYRVIVRGTRTIPVTYEIQTSGAPRAIGVGQADNGELPVGGITFYRTDLKAGQLVVFDLTTNRFDSTLTLFNAQGKSVISNDDRGLELSSRITHLSRSEGSYYVRVSSNSQGGGGAFTLAARERPVKELKPGIPSDGALEPGGIDVWSFKTTAGKAYFASLSSKAFDTELRVFDPSGVELIRDDNSGIGTDSLGAIKIEEEGTYSIRVSSRTGSGAYTLRLFE